MPSFGDLFFQSLVLKWSVFTVKHLALRATSKDSFGAAIGCKSYIVLSPAITIGKIHLSC